MRAFWRRHDSFEEGLRARMPQASEDLVRNIAGRIEHAERPRRRSGFALVFVGAVAASMVVALASVGGIGYAASAVTEAADVVVRVISPDSVATPQNVRAISAGGDQYRPGFGFGDPNHTHTGPPGLERRPGTPPPTPRRIANRTIVSTSVALDEQAVLWISVFGPGGRQAVISQAGTTIGGGELAGRPTKAIKYVVLVPRVIQIDLAIVLGRFDRPGDYEIRVLARDPDGEEATQTFAFTVPTDVQIAGTPAADRVFSPGAGNDVILTAAGNDRVVAGGGNDRVAAGRGNDVVIGGPGDDVLFGGPGNDRVFGNRGTDTIYGGPGNDRINVRGGGRDRVICGPCVDTVFADALDSVAGDCERVSR